MMTASSTARKWGTERKWPDTSRLASKTRPGAALSASGGDDTRVVLLRDLLSEHRYTRRWCDVTAKGLWVGLKPWQAHAFEVVPLATLL